MAHLSFKDGGEEITSLLKHGKEEFDNGHHLVALAMLFEAQFTLNQMVQGAMEGSAQLPSSMNSPSKLAQ
jgi:hypothetical protein